MQRRHTEHIFFTVGVACLFLLTADSLPSAMNSSPTPTQTQPDSPLALSKPNCVHVDLQPTSLGMQSDDAKSRMTLRVAKHADASPPGSGPADMP